MIEGFLAIAVSLFSSCK